MSAADSIRVTVYGRGGHGSMPQDTVDPVVLAAMITIRLQTIVSREVAPDDTAVVTVGSSRAGTRNNVIPDFAVLELNVRSYSAVTRQRMLDAIKRIVRAECQASDSPKMGARGHPARFRDFRRDRRGEHVPPTGRHS
ncbi:MAG TPA: peptidase dimerization domain-containing protein [Trebonia sp.]|nr:peptidase dimerization domain-containing protein [Trebonia sp.]